MVNSYINEKKFSFVEFRSVEETSNACLTASSRRPGAAAAEAITARARGGTRTVGPNPSLDLAAIGLNPSALRSASICRTRGSHLHRRFAVLFRGAAGSSCSKRSDHAKFDWFATRTMEIARVTDSLSTRTSPSRTLRVKA